MLTLLFTSGPLAGRRIELVGELVLGREGVDLIVEDREVSRRHAVVRPRRDGAEIQDLGSLNGTWVNDRRITGPTRLADGDRVRLGATHLELEVPQAAAGPGSAAPPVTPAAPGPSAAPPSMPPVAAAAPPAPVEPPAASAAPPGTVAAPPAGAAMPPPVPAPPPPSTPPTPAPSAAATPRPAGHGPAASLDRGPGAGPAGATPPPTPAPEPPQAPEPVEQPWPPPHAQAQPPAQAPAPSEPDWPPPSPVVEPGPVLDRTAGPADGEPAPGSRVNAVTLTYAVVIATALALLAYFLLR